MINKKLALQLLKAWAKASEKYWYDIPGHTGLGCYGSGYNSWGVQTNQKYIGAMATLGTSGHPRALKRALAALRFSLASHVSGSLQCMDGTQWGHTWISTLGIERMMHGVYRLMPHMTGEDKAALRRVLTSEAHWLVHDYERGGVKGVHAGLWKADGKNAPESNFWNGAILWRAAKMYPDEPEASAWCDMARTFFINSVSISADAASQPRFMGANFFQHYALDHHGYLNVGYMVICVSNAALLHFDLQMQGLPRPEELDHHQRDLWQVLRRMIFGNGRLARIGGDGRIRYAYCQDYLLPALLYAADSLGDAHAPALVDALLRLMAEEQAYNGDGSFYGRRLEIMAEENHYYYTRLESDRADVLAMALNYALVVRAPAAPDRDFESSVAGGWHEPEHGVVLHRCATRLASFSWRAFGGPQGMCQLPDDGHLAEWTQNLSGLVFFVDHFANKNRGAGYGNRRFVRNQTACFEGGFVTCGMVNDGADIMIEEGWRGQNLAAHRIAFAALPDGHTVVGLEHVQTGQLRTYCYEAQGMHLNLPNDLYNRFKRTLTAEHGRVTLKAPAPAEEEEALGLNINSRWANIDGKVGVLGLYGAKTLSVVRAAQRCAGPYPSLYVEEIAWFLKRGMTALDANSVIFDVGWAVASSVDADTTHRWAKANRTAIFETGSSNLRCVRVRGFDKRDYIVLANFGTTEERTELPVERDLATGEVFAGRPAITIGPDEAKVFLSH
ncbi:MAG: hypothetical protein Q7J98_09915 [Kiritimatiellia bacterium]|nr:hypothetical protein [Kiritimatiellia bacterium]